MASCFKCTKPVYFAERIVSSGKEWHRICFTCTECGKILAPGKHSEHKGLPYCEVPCYFVLFGPNIYRQGIPRLGVVPVTQPTRPAAAIKHETEREVNCEQTKETLNGDRASDSDIDVTEMAEKRWPELESRLACYNDYYADTPKLQIASNEMEGIYVLEGQLHVYWGLQRPIRFQQKDESPLPLKYRHSSYCFTVSNEVNGSHEDHDALAVYSPEIIDSSDTNGLELKDDGEVVVMRKRVRKRRSVKRLSIINGHCYDVETSIFVPSYGSVTSVMATTLDFSPQVIRLLLDKFKVENYPDEYSLCIVKSSGETRALADADIPLLQRIFLGPLEDDAKIFIVERHQMIDIPQEVAPFVCLPEAVLIGFLAKCNRDEEKEIQWIRDKYNIRRDALEQRLAEIAKL